MLPTKKEWKKFFKFRKNICLKLIISDTEHKKRVEESLKNIQETKEAIKRCNKILKIN